MSRAKGDLLVEIKELTKIFPVRADSSGNRRTACAPSIT